MKILLDTNILVGLCEENRRARMAQAIRRQRTLGDELCLVPQVLYEFWVVATRPADDNGLAMGPKQTEDRVREMVESFPLRDDVDGIYNVWLDIVSAQHVQGKRAHDARLVAALRIHKLDAIMTENAGDFAGLGVSLIKI